MTPEQWEMMVRELISQGVVQNEAEAIRRLATGDKLPFTARVQPSEWRGLYGTSE